MNMKVANPSPRVVNRLMWAAVCFCFVAIDLHADTIVLSNGDRVTGKVINTSDGKMTVKSDLMGDVVVALKDIVAIETAGPLTASFADGEKVIGTVATEGEQVKVTREDQSQIIRQLSELEALRDAERQQAYEREQQRQTSPGWLDFWALEADLGLAAARGNASTTTINSGAQLKRATGLDKTTFTFEQIYSTQRTTEPFGTTANALTAAGRYERDLTSNLFVYTGASFEFDEFQDLDLRTVLGGGLGWHVIRQDRHSWDVGGGGNWNREDFSDDTLRNSGELNFYEESSHQITQALRLYQGFHFFPNLTESGEYRFRLRAGADVNLNRFLAITFLISNKYLSNPLPENKKSDMLFSTGIQFSWAQN